MKPFKITIVGSSVGLRIRPNDISNLNLNYGQFLESLLLEDGFIGTTINNLSLSRLLITEVEYNLDFYIRTYPDYYVINIGAVDAPNREISLWFSNIIFKRTFKPLYPIAIWIYNSIIAKYLRKYFVVMRFYTSWVSKKRFLNSFDHVIEKLIKETNAKIIVLGINKGNSNIDIKLPGTTKKYLIYNELILQIVKKYSLDYINVSNLDSKDYYPDGVHYNSLGHSYIANELFKIIKKHV